MVQTATNIFYNRTGEGGQGPGEEEKKRELSVTVTGDEVMEAKNQPVTEEKIREQLNKTGESEFFFEELQIITGEKTFLPMGKIKELRRTAFDKLTEEILAGYRRELPLIKTADTMKELQEPFRPKKAEAPETIALVSAEEQLQIVLDEPRITTVYVDLQNAALNRQVEYCKETRMQGKRAFLVLPHIFRDKEKKRYSTIVELLKRGDLDGFLVKSLEELQFLEENALAEQTEIRLNYNLYTFQKNAKRFFKEKGCRRFTASVELNEEELLQLGVEDCDFILYGRIPLMVSAQCVRDNIFGCASGKKTEGITLTDRVGAEFPVRQICSSCYNVIYNSACFSLLGMKVENSMTPAGWRLDFTLETAAETRAVLDAFFEGKACEIGKGPYTKGHFRRGIE